MLTEYYAVKERKNVLIMATKTGQDAVWEPELQDRLPELAGGEFSNVLVMAHTDLSTQDAPEVVRRLKERVDVVIIDEAHNFRNHGRQGDDVDTPRSRWWRMQEICEGKTVFLLTATPINNSLFDLVHQAEMFTGACRTTTSRAVGVEQPAALRGRPGEAVQGPGEGRPVDGPRGVRGADAPRTSGWSRSSGRTAASTRWRARRSPVPARSCSLM